MALTRKYLKSMGLTEEQVDSIIDAHTETLEGLKNKADQYEADAKKLKAVEKELSDLKADGGEDYKAKYEAECEAHAKTKADHAAKETAAMHERLFRAELTRAGITGKRADQIVKATDLTAYKVKDGAYEDGQAVQDSIRSEWGEFIPATTVKGADVVTPPANNGGKYASRAEIMAIKDTAERQKAIASHLDLFGK